MSRSMTTMRKSDRRVPAPGRAGLAPILLGLALAVSGCAGPTAPPESETDTDDQAASDDECYIHLFDGDDFDEDDDNFRLTEPGTYANLDDLPGADQDWTDEADSARVGESATVTIYSEIDFGGESTTLDPGSEHPDLDPEPSSLEMTCE